MQVSHLLKCLHEYQQSHTSSETEQELSLPAFKRRLYSAVELKGGSESRPLMSALQALSDEELEALRRFVNKKQVVARDDVPQQQRVDSRDNMADVDDNTSVLSYGDDENLEDEALDFFESSASLAHSHDLDRSLSPTSLSKLTHGPGRSPSSSSSTSLESTGIADKADSSSHLGRSALSTLTAFSATGGSDRPPRGANSTSSLHQQHHHQQQHQQQQSGGAGGAWPWSPPTQCCRGWRAKAKAHGAGAAEGEGKPAAASARASKAPANTPILAQQSMPATKR